MSKHFLFNHNLYVVGLGYALVLLDVYKRRNIDLISKVQDFGRQKLEEEHRGFYSFKQFRHLQTVQNFCQDGNPVNSQEMWSRSKTG